MSDNKLEVLNEESGPLSFKKKLFLKVVGMFCIWIGKALMSVSTWEQIHLLKEQFEEKANSIEDLENKLDESNKMSNQQAEELAAQFCKRQNYLSNEIQDTQT